MELGWLNVIGAKFKTRHGQRITAGVGIDWRNFKLHSLMQARIVKFYFQKVDGTIREAYGTLAAALIPPTSDGNARTKNDTVQTYWDSEKMAWRCFKKANLIDVVY